MSKWCRWHLSTRVFCSRRSARARRGLLVLRGLLWRREDREDWICEQISLLNTGQHQVNRNYEHTYTLDFYFNAPLYSWETAPPFRISRMKLISCNSPIKLLTVFSCSGGSRRGYQAQIYQVISTVSISVVGRNCGLVSVGTVPFRFADRRKEGLVGRV